MNIDYNDSDKAVRCYRDFVLNPGDRKAVRLFQKTFGQQLMAPAKKLHDRLLAYPTAGEYNSLYGSTDNRIELKSGVRNNDPLILKTRITGAWRKFFNRILDEAGNLLLTRDWNGDFCNVSHIYVIATNNHDYNNV